MKPFQVFRMLTFICLIIILAISALHYFDVVSSKLFAIVSGLIAILASVFGLFATKPVEKEDVSVAVDKLLLTYDKDTIETLQQAKKEEEAIKDFIEHRSNEIFLLKLRNYLEDQIIVRYKGSEIAKLVNDLKKIEDQLDDMKIQYGEIALPERFKKIVERLNEEEKVNIYLGLLDTLPLPGYFVAFYKASIRSAFSLRRIIPKLMETR